MSTEKHWDIHEVIGKDLRVTVKLQYDGRTVHELRGPTARKTLQDYADKLNRDNAPEPDPKIRIGADGFHFKEPPKKAKDAPVTVIPSMAAWAKKHGIIK